VFTSFALLGNAVWCENMKWEVGGAVDGTHGMSKSSYKLITLSVYGFSAETGGRTFHPLVYVWGEGEREIVALHGFLNLQVALRHLFGIESICFKHGIVSDATSVFVNSVSRASPGTPLLSCYPHIIRKFKVDQRPGNGAYLGKLTRQPPKWLSEEAEPANRKLSLCKTKSQKDLMWQLTKKRWEEDEETNLARTFEKTYIDDINYANWFCKASGAHGSVPCNNPMERHNLTIKGTSNVCGYVENRQNMFACLTKEFVKLVYYSSVGLTCPTSDLPVLDYRKATSNNEFMEYQSLLDPGVDVKEYGGGWLVNDVEYLTAQITDDDVYKIEFALAGVIEEEVTSERLHEVRDMLLNRCKRFHHVTSHVHRAQTGNLRYFACDCRDYYYHRWCVASAYMQHREN
jgi:hypothetical protein